MFGYLQFQGKDILLCPIIVLNLRQGLQYFMGGRIFFITIFNFINEKVKK